MGKLQLIYFNLTGRGEAIRYMLHHRKVDFEDKRVQGEEWMKIKPSALFSWSPPKERIFFQQRQWVNCQCWSLTGR